MAVGLYTAYSTGGKAKKVRIGKVVTITKAEASAVVHRHRPLSDGRLRVQWVPTFDEDAHQNKSPNLETVHADSSSLSCSSMMECSAMDGPGSSTKEAGL